MPAWWDDVSEFSDFVVESAKDVASGRDTPRTQSWRQSIQDFADAYNSANTIPGVDLGAGDTSAFSPIGQFSPIGVASRLGQAVGQRLNQAGVLPFTGSQATREQAANLAPNQSGPSQSFQPGQPLFRPGTAGGILKGNPLNRYINVQYHIIFSAISEQDAKNVQTSMINNSASCGKFVNEMQQAVRKDGSVTIASTGEIFRNQATEVSESEIRRIDATEDQRTSASAQVAALEQRIKDLKKQQAEREAVNPGTVTSDINAQIWNTTRAIEAVKNGLPVPEDKEVLLPAELRGVNRRYYNIKSMTFTNYMSPTPENPLFSNFVGGEITLVEPHGFQLHEDLRLIANTLGYRGVHTHRVVYRLDIYFSGYDQDSGRWVNFIPISSKANADASGCDGSIVSIYMSITGMEAKTTHTGTEYRISLAPAGAHCLRPEDATLEATSVERGKTFGEFLKIFSAQLEKQKKSQVRSTGSDRTEDFTIERLYEFIAPEDLANEPWPAQRGDSSEKDNSEDPADGGLIQFQKGDSIISALKDAMWDLPKVQREFLAVNDGNNEEFTYPRIRYTIRMNTIYDEKNERINDYRKIRFQYIIEPHLTFKDFTPTTDEATLKALSLQARLKRLKEMIAYGMIQRRYDYLFTGLNTEILDLDLSFKVFYYKTMAQDDTNSQAYGQATLLAATTDANAADAVTENENQSPPQNQALDNVDAQFRTAVENNVNATLKRLFGFAPSNMVDPSSPTLAMMAMALTPAQKHYGSKSSNKTDSATTGKYNQKNLFMREFDDNLANDLLKIEMTVRGDPVYLFSPYATEDLNTLEPFDAIRFTNSPPVTGGNPDTAKLTVTPSTDKVIFLKVLAPNQTDFMNPNRELGSSKNTIIGGFYTVIKVEMMFENGSFKQKLHAIKMPNLNYLTENIGIFKEQGSTGRPVENDGATDNA